MRTESEWRCKKCGKLLGLHTGTRLHIRYARGHEYLVGFPATGTCRGCGTLNDFCAQPPDGQDFAGIPVPSVVQPPPFSQ